MTGEGGGEPGDVETPIIGMGQSVEDLLRAGVARHQGNDHAGAEVLYLEALRRAPRNPTALNFLGILRNHQGRNDEAIELLEAATRLDPNYADAWNNVGNAFGEAGRMEESQAAYRRTLELNPSHVGAWNNLATVLRGLGRLEESLEAHGRAIELAPRVADVYVNYANTVRATGNVEHAIAAYQKAIALNPAHSRANVRFGYLLYLVGRREDAAKIFQDWLAREPDNPEAKHLLAACTGDGVPDRASNDYVRHTFDQFADSFDSRLLHDLEYRAPEIVGAAIRARVEPEGTLNVLDAGCGTGLCGPHLRPFARTLVGIDLSARMLEKAANRKVYDELAQVEITEFLSGNPGRFDLIASADTLVYFGALEEVMGAAHDSLRQGGLLVFTVEANDGCERGFRIEPHGRYSHDADYLRRVLADAGFISVDLEPVVPRREAGEDVRGFVVRAEAAGSEPGG